jgi:HSP20 family protein
MLNVTRWTPWTELAGLHRDLDSIFGRVFGDQASGRTGHPWVPAADVRREQDKWMLSMALPGISPDKVEINVIGRTLRVRGERLPIDNGKTEPVLSEIGYGSFEREFTLPEDIDAQHVQAAYRHGMLELELPVHEAAKPRRIEIKTETDAKQLQAA